jgi:hypothetical protein
MVREELGIMNDEDEIPWANLSANMLEELLLVLVQAMSPRSVEWRSRPNVINTSDGGRDIEAAFDVTTPDGDVETQTWWIDCKKRTSTVRPGDVKEVILNATVKKGVDVFVVATNSHFSNPTSDWVKEHNDRFPKPLAKLWDRTQLSRLVRKYPAAAAQALPDLLTPIERRELVISQFFERARIMPEPDLDFFWETKPTVRNNGALIVAATYSELVHGSWTKRPWATAMHNQEVAAEALVLAFTSLPLASAKSNRLNNEKITQSITYILLNSLRIISADTALEILKNPFEFIEGFDGRDDEGVIRRAVVLPVMQLALRELADACSDDCFRLSIDPPLTLDPGEYGEHYWKRFSAPAEIARSLILTNLSQPCVVGFPVSDEHPCPLMKEPTVSRDVIDVMRHVVEFRLESPQFQALAAAPAPFRERAQKFVEDERHISFEED